MATLHSLLADIQALRHDCSLAIEEFHRFMAGVQMQLNAATGKSGARAATGSHRAEPDGDAAPKVHSVADRKPSDAVLYAGSIFEKADLHDP
ncbi:MAG: hypothetical protein KatS3mg109_2088 [Pirellulaceae bacterium]|nr:MAG: hypothetical protein KatS3mg109_2088 [Pirellulaceae bacterium]